MMHRCMEGSRQLLAASLVLTSLIAGGMPLPVAAQDAAQEVNLSVPQAKALARQALQQGNLALADAISSTLLKADPKDAEALMIRALVARGTGNLAAAEDAAAKAYRSAGNPDLKFDAAMLTADILTRQEKFTRAQLWLRRADQTASSDERRALAGRSYNQVARRNPLQVQLRFTAKPSSNVNNGSPTDTIELGGLPFRLDPSGVALGGYEASTGMSLAYRLSENETQKTEVLGEFFYRYIWLDGDAKDEAPDVDGTDFNYGVVITGVRHQRMIWPDLGPSQVTGLIGQSWYGDDPLARWIELQGAQTVRQGNDGLFRFGLTARTENRLDDEINDSESLSASLDYRFAAEGGGVYSFGTTLKNVWSDSATVDLFSYGLRVSRSFDQIGMIRPTLNASAEHRNYHKWSATAGGREDVSVSLGVTAVFPDVSYYGFAPQITLNARRTRSDVEIYDREELSLGLTAVSRF